MGGLAREVAGVGRPGRSATRPAGHLDCPVLVVDGQDVAWPESVLAHEPAVVAGLDMVGAQSRCC